MGELTKDNAQSILAACRDNAAAICECLNQCLGTTHQLEVGELSAWQADTCPPSSTNRCSGHSSRHAVADLPDSRQLALARVVHHARQKPIVPAANIGHGELAPTNLLPSDLEAGTTVTVAVDNLKQEIIDRQPADWAATIELTIAGSGESSGTTPAGRLLLVWPVAQVGRLKAKRRNRRCLPAKRLRLRNRRLHPRCRRQNRLRRRDRLHVPIEPLRKSSLPSNRRAQNVW